MSAFPARPLRRVLLSTLATVAGVVVLLTLKPHTTASAGDVAAGSAAPAPAPSATSGTSGSSNGPSSGSSSGSSNGPSNGSSSKGTSGTRTVDGDTAQTRYGPVQLRLTLTGGRITAVKAVQLPNDNPRDGEISGFAIPQLTQETLAAQSAKIDTVSGATYTSEGYVRSLQSALDKAGV
ncbi:FMN-binding protein [Streptomyces sp. NPDC008079]|uniref:FMN-binding protein n=1 Tax=Streptomyces sp. NPDC008079 TaxID=3364806 RepID=UPI0036E63D5C